MTQENFVRENPIFLLMEMSGHQPSELGAAFPGFSVENIVSMLHDNRLGLRRTVERFGYLGIRRCNSNYFNVHENGSRSNGSNSVSNNDGYLVHCYGGSTTVGQNVADHQTISAFLETHLRKKIDVNVFNFGAGNHTSLHSSLRLLDHVLSGNIPDLAIFLNGFNDCFYSAGGADGILQFLDQVLEASQHSKERATKLKDLVDLIPQYPLEPKSIKITGYEIDEQIANHVSNVYAASVSIQKFVIKHFGVKVLRFIEPTSFLHCRADQFLLPRISSGNIRFELVRRLYNLIGDHGSAEVFGNEELISLVDIGQDLLPGPLYVDELHFSPAFNEHIAERIMANVRFSRRDSSKRQRKFPTREIKGALDEVVNPYNYPLF